MSPVDDFMARTAALLVECDALRARCEASRVISEALRAQALALLDKSNLLRTSYDAQCRGEPMKVCTKCGAKYNLRNWRALTGLGHQRFPTSGGEMRNCPCSSTLFLKTYSGMPAVAQIAMYGRKAA